MTQIPTSDSEIRAACPGISTYVYRDLARMTALPRLPFALLYETEPGYGHWVGVLDTPEGVEHFDSYGLLPDAELAWVPKKYRAAFGAASPHLVRLLLESGRPIVYNQYRLQGRGKIATCGRWTVARCRNRAMTTDQFAGGMRALAKELRVSPDALTVMMLPPSS